VQEIADGILIDTTFRGVTVGAVRTDRGFILIDTPSFPQDAKHWRVALQSYADLPIYAVIMLDAHRDRMLGASWFKPELFIAHTTTYETVASLSNSYVSTIASMLTVNPNEQTSLLAGKILKPTITFSKNMELRLGQMVLRVSHRPGPARGSIWVHCIDRRVIFVGDSVVMETPPHVNSAHSLEWLEALTLLQNDLEGTIIVPGRGGPTTDKQVIQHLTSYLQLARERVQSLYDSHRTLSDTARIIHELLALYPPPLEHELEEVQQRVRTSLQFIYNEFREQELTPGGASTTAAIELESQFADLADFELEEIEIDSYRGSDEPGEEDDFGDFDED
jgi:glyoxylase-like metal-dependent hydrolase (beta-lactamase superfamily II)